MLYSLVKEHKNILPRDSRDAVEFLSKHSEIVFYVDFIAVEGFHKERKLGLREVAPRFATTCRIQWFFDLETFAYQWWRRNNFKKKENKYYVVLPQHTAVEKTHMNHILEGASHKVKVAR